MWFSFHASIGTSIRGIYQYTNRWLDVIWTFEEVFHIPSNKTSLLLFLYQGQRQWLYMHFFALKRLNGAVSFNTFRVNVYKIL